MGTVIRVIMMMLVWCGSIAAQVKVVGVKGEVTVRHGIQREWFPVQVGDILRPDDSMRSGRRSSAVIVIDGSRRVVISENVIIDLSDFRTLTQDELLLMLAMQQVRSVPDGTQRDGLMIPQTTVIHGDEKSPVTQGSRSIETGVLQLNGTRVLHNLGYYATCVLRAKEVLRLYPELMEKIDVRLMIASALEHEHLKGEALNEYISLTKEELSGNDRAFVQEKIEQLKKGG